MFTEAVAQGFSVKKGVLRNFAKFTGKHLCRRLFLNKVAGLIVYKFCKIDTYCVNKQCIIFLYFFFLSSTAKSLIKHAQWRVLTKRKYVKILDKKKRQ